MVDDILRGSEDLLRSLIDVDLDTIDSSKVPAKKYLEVQTVRTQLYKGAVPFCGSLSLIERAQIANWFEQHVTRDPKLRTKWMGLLPIAHAQTIYITSFVRAEDRRLKEVLKSRPPDELTEKEKLSLLELSEEEILDRAWNIQLTATPSVLQDIDVDRECLEALEMEMFERSNRAGLAGNCQWGLDAGDHQQHTIYAGVPHSWHSTSGERYGDDAELTVCCPPMYISQNSHSYFDLFQEGPNFIRIERPEQPNMVPTDTRPRPKPVPRFKKKKNGK